MVSAVLLPMHSDDHMLKAHCTCNMGEDIQNSSAVRDVDKLLHPLPTLADDQVRRQQDQHMSCLWSSTICVYILVSPTHVL